MASRKTAAQLVCAALGTVVLIAGSVLTTINTYGLHIESWGWLIGGSLATIVLGAILKGVSE